MTRRQPVSVLAALCVALLALPAAARGAEMGLNMNGGAAAATPANFAQLTESGARWARHFVVFDGQDTPDAGYDAIVAREQAMGVKTLLVVTGVGGYKPSDPEVYARFVGRLAQRYRGRVDAYEIWNEPDEPAFWAGGGDPVAYTALLRAANRTIKAADPAATVLFGALTGANYGFLDAAYAAGARGSFDAVAVHTDYPCLLAPPTDFYREQDGRIGRFTFLGYRDLRALMLARGDDKPIWMTEFGWSANDQVCGRGDKAGKQKAGVSEATQAANLRLAAHCMAADPYLQVAMWFNSRDLVGDGSELDSYGLKRIDGSDRLAAAAFRDVAAGRDTVTGGCGDFTGPAVEILSPRPGVRLGPRDSLVIRARSSASDVVRVTFADEDAAGKIRNFTNEGKPLDLARTPARLDWQGVRKLAFGRHRIVVTMLDANGNPGTASVVVERVDPSRLTSRRVSFARLRVGGRGLRRVLTGALVSPLRFSIGGKVRVQWQARRGGRWKRVHGAAANANRPLRFAQTLRYPGRWRVRVLYAGARPFRPARSPWVGFTAG